MCDCVTGQGCEAGGSVLCGRNGRLVNVKVRDLVEGDWVALSYGDGFPFLPQSLSPMELSPLYGSQKAIRVPVVMDTDLALLLGMYAAEGHTNKTNYTIVITNSDETVLERCVQLWQSCFGLRARIARQLDRCPGVEVASKTVVEFMDNLGCGKRASEKRIPRVIMTSPEPVVLAFLQGLSLDAYTSSTGRHGKVGDLLGQSRVARRPADGAKASRPAVRPDHQVQRGLRKEL